MNFVITEVVFGIRTEIHHSGLKFDAESISGHAGAIYYELVNLERGATVTFQI